ncbi:hypothetical protein MMC17_007732 [Xylographa soralifera]|nr:hypothetical protein [Xylographa soralifera]
MPPGLLSLSAELNREVMKYLFGYMHTIHISHGAESEYTMGSILEDDEPEVESLNPSILRVCSELRASGMSVLYGFHTFEFLGVEAFRWFITRSDTSLIRHIRVLFEEDISDTVEWIRYWRSTAFRTALPRLETAEVDTVYTAMTGERKRWLDIRLDIACEMLERSTPQNCKVVKKYV